MLGQPGFTCCAVTDDSVTSDRIAAERQVAIIGRVDGRAQQPLANISRDRMSPNFSNGSPV
jgi:hypothetical protein